VSVRPNDELDRLLMGIGLPDDLVEVALKGEAKMPDAALERMKRRTLEKVKGAQVRPWYLRLLAPTAAVVAAAAVIGVVVWTGTAPDSQTPATLPPGQGGDAIDVGPLTGDIAHDASASLRKFFEMLNEGDHENARRLINPMINVFPDDVKVEGIQRYTFKGIEEYEVEEEFWKSPADMITARVVIGVEAGEGLSHPVFQAGENRLLVRMLKGGDGRWTIGQFQAEEGVLWPDSESNHCGDLCQPGR